MTARAAAKKRTLPIAIPLTLLLVVTLAPGAQAAPLSSATLATWHADTSGHQDPATFTIGPNETFENYVFRLTSGQGVPLSVAYMHLANTHGDTICQGPVTHHLVMSVHRTCTGLRAGHTYTLTWVTDRGGNELTLYGNDPIA